MKNLTIRNVPKRLAEALNRERRRRDQSLNATVLDLLGRSLGVGPEGRPTNGLARLAGTWTADEHQQFEAAVAPFETVDDEMWR
jgi:plasmid stability protein